MYRELLNILKCPICGQPIKVETKSIDGEEIIEGTLVCENKHNFNISMGVINFGAAEQEFANNWTETYKEQNYDEVDKEIADGTPDNIKKINEDTKSYIIGCIDKIKPSYVLDIATGRGMLLTEMVKRIPNDTHVICTDLSFDVLVYDRLKVKEINPEMKVDYIACDATKLPFIDDSIDCAASFFGIANMLGVTKNGIKDAARVLKKGCHLLNSFIVIDANSIGFESVAKVLEDNDMSGCEKYLNKFVLEKTHLAEFASVDVVTIGESIGEENKFDLIPVKGEWFAEIVLNCVK